jgi:hypothetical protein
MAKSSTATIERTTTRAQLILIPFSSGFILGRGGKTARSPIPRGGTVFVLLSGVKQKLAPISA